MNRTNRILLLCALLSLGAFAAARDSIEASPYGNVFADLIAAFHAERVPCEGVATGIAEVCFRAETVSASYLAERLSEIVNAYDSVGLSSGGWRSANGVWTVALTLPNDRFGQLEIYLAEVPENLVKGVVRLVSPR
jgi:hypothetical protein